MTRARPRPRGRPAAAARLSRLRPCTYTPDSTLPDPADAEHPLCGAPGCGLPQRHPRHTLPAAPPAQAEHRRRTGERDEEPE